jgi:hypothetical protein
MNLGNDWDALLMEARQANSKQFGDNAEICKNREDLLFDENAERYAAMFAEKQTLRCDYLKCTSGLELSRMNQLAPKHDQEFQDAKFGYWFGWKSSEGKPCCSFKCYKARGKLVQKEKHRNGDYSKRNPKTRVNNSSKRKN